MGEDMALELEKATSASNSAFRVVCGKMIVNGNQNLHHEALFGKVLSWKRDHGGQQFRGPFKNR